MHAADATGTATLPEPHEYKTLNGELQAGTRGLALESTGNGQDRKKVFICDKNSIRRAKDSAAFREHGNEVIACDPSLEEYSFYPFERLLSDVALVRFDFSQVDLNTLKRLLHVCDYRRRNGMKPFLVGTSVDGEDEFKAHLHRVLYLDRIVASQIRPIPRDATSGHRWGIEIVHRWWVGETICTAGEEVFQVSVFNDLRKEPVSLAMKDRVILDQIARCKVAQSAAQWAASLSANPWVAKHGSRGSGAKNFKCRFSRAGFKQAVYRLRSRLVSEFEHVGVEIHPMLVVKSTPCGREVQYRWNPDILVVWDHQES